MITTHDLRALLTSQEPDNTWLIKASEILKIPVNILEQPNWHEANWRTEWGELEIVFDDNLKEQITVWHRPDGAQALAADTHPLNVRSVQFALMAELMLLIQKDNKMSYVEIDMDDKRWRNAKVYYKGVQLAYVYKADALLNTVEVAVRDRGKFTYSKDKTIIATRTLKGDVEIVLSNESQAFF